MTASRDTIGGAATVARPLTDRAGLWLASFVLRRRWLVLAASLAIAVAAGSGLGRLEFVTDYQVFFSPGNPDRQAFERFQETYTKHDNIIFVLKPRAGDVFTPATLAAIEDLTARAWSIPFAIRVDSITNFQHSRAEAGGLAVSDLVRDAATLSPPEIAEIREIAVAEPILRDYLVTPTGSATGINVTLQMPGRSPDEVPAAMAAVRALAAAMRAAHPDLEIAATGGLAMNAAFTEATLVDAVSLYPTMLLLLILVTAVILRSVVATGATLMVVVLSTVTAVGIAGHAGWLVTPVSGSAPVIILTLAIADSIHVLVSMFALVHAGQDKIAALKESLRINVLAVVVTSLTTMVGFLALNFSDSPPFHDLGNVAAVGIAAALVFSLTFLPAALAVLPVGAGRAAARETALMTRFAHFVIRRRRAILVTVGTASAVLVAAIPTIELSDDWVGYFSERTAFRRDAEFVRENLTGQFLLEYSVPSSGNGGINEPAYLAELADFADWLRAQPEVRHVFAYSDIVKRLNRNMHGDDPAYARIPDSRELAAQYLLLYELSLPYGLDLRNRVSVDESATRLTAALSNVPTAAVRAFIDRSSAWLEANAPPHMFAEPTGATVMFARISERNIRAMLRGNAVAIVLIAFVMAVALRSAGLGAMSLIPNAIPILMTFGLWAILVGRVGLAAATVSATSLGIIVDNSVHYLTKYLRGRREKGLGRQAAVVYAFETVGLAILANAMILAAGFSVLAFSSFRVSAELGMLTAVAIVIALVVDFLMLPALLLIGDKTAGDDDATDSIAP